MGKPRRLCEDCGKGYYNLPAHLEECPGPVSYERVEFQCGACLATANRSRWCCGRWMSRVHTGAYHHPRPNPL